MAIRRFMASQFAKPVLWLVLLIVLAGAGGGAYWIYVATTGEEEEALAEDQRLVPVTRGDLINSVSVNGKLKFPTTRNLAFDAPGKLAELTVEEGQQVTEGQRLASLDATSVASLETALAKANLDLSKAEKALLDAMKAPHTPLEIAEAELKKAEAANAILTARKKLLDILQPTPGKMAQAQDAVADARVQIRSAEQALAPLTAKAAQDKTDDLSLAIKYDQVKLDTAQRTHSLTLEEWNTKVADAEKIVESKAKDYRQVFSDWLGIGPDVMDDSMSPDDLLARWSLDLDAIFRPNGFYADLSRVEIPTQDDPNTVWNELTIFAFTYLSPFSIQPTCDKAPAADSGIYCISHLMSESWKKLTPVRDDLAKVQEDAATALASTADAVAKAEDSLATASKNLADHLALPDPVTLAGREQKLALAITKLEEAEAELARLEAGARLGNALADMPGGIGDGEGLTSSLLEGVSQALRIEVLAAREGLENAHAKLTDAEKSLQDILAKETDALTIALREAELTAARLEVGAAEKRLDGITLSSPLSGIVTEINVKTGDSVEAGATIMTVVDPSIVEAEGPVDEIDILSLQVGMPATVAMEALQGRPLPGAVSFISPTADNQRGVVTYDVRIRVEAPRGIPVRQGLTAFAQVILSLEPDVLLIPMQALRGPFNQPTVLVSTEDVVEERTIIIGNSDDFWVTVEQGLSEGDMVVMEGVRGAPGFGFGGMQGADFEGFEGEFSEMELQAPAR